MSSSTTSLSSTSTTTCSCESLSKSTTCHKSRSCSVDKCGRAKCHDLKPRCCDQRRLPCGDCCLTGGPCYAREYGGSGVYSAQGRIGLFALNQQFYGATITRCSPYICGGGCRPRQGCCKKDNCGGCKKSKSRCCGDKKH